MCKLIQQLEASLPKGIPIPEPLKMLYEWIERNGFYVDGKNGLRYGSLYLEDKRTEEAREGGTNIAFVAEGNEWLHYWFGTDSEEIRSRLCVFAQSGGEGSQCALWKDDEGEIKIVHMGSGSGSLLTCVLADNAVDFLRLLAIGYDEICWDEDYLLPPNEGKDFIVKPNIEFQNWVREIFGVSIPKTALEIVKYPASMDDEDSEDAFCSWSQKQIK